MADEEISARDQPLGASSATTGSGNASLQATRIFLRPIANPFALGMLGLAGDTVMLAGRELGWIPAGQKTQVALMILIFAPVLQLIACVFGFLGRDPIAATGMGVLAGTWAIIGMVHLLSPAGSRSVALATFLFLAASAVGLSATAGMKTKVVPGLVMLMTGIRWFTTGLYEVLGGADLKMAAGIVGLLLAAVAIYGAFAVELENLEHRQVLPVLRRGRGKYALSPLLVPQVEEIAAEPGVRNQL